ncbi:MAG: glycosyl transferase [Chitinophagia bacterium]|nr:glycosyl transferase [Chitinophagia bacterium]
MKILFAIQGTGNGHLSRARDVYPELCKYGEVDVLISGIQADMALPYPVKYRLYGMSFIFGKHGGVAIGETIRRSKIIRLLKDIRTLPIDEYDLVINDFEPVSAWACHTRKKACISLSHQCAVLHPAAPKPTHTDYMGMAIIKHYAPTTAAYGFHFKEYANNIFTPVIRREIRQITTTNKGHYTVYLPAYSDEAIISRLSSFKDIEWDVYSKHCKGNHTAGNVHIKKINNEAFVQSMADSAGVLLGAGFEGPAEAMYLGKKVLVIPMSTQYEQHCNAAGAADMGATVIPQLSHKNLPAIGDWINNGKPCKVDYPDNISTVVAKLMQEQVKL